MAKERPILGLTEEITISSEQGAAKETVIARIDTGATLSSIDTELAKTLGITTIIREKTVKSASGKSVRPVVNATVEIKGQQIEGEFSLANRKSMKYQVLIGQNHLKKGNYLVDPQID